ncbi:phosphoglucosamine mutase [Marinicrinis sediminis]|uniref:Phosphoglucosamine mutase n=1 Tax=Marinicrinis sediminis TaxID=1652465 RepID=A0ABW5RF10_9BACL
MGKYFGTDGVRGVANEGLTPEMAFQIGRAGGYVLAGQSERPTVVIGQDTRISGPMLEAALTAGLLSIGANVVRLGVVTTPCVAFLTKASGADAGVMISASHNPVADNGIKFFGSDGFKLSDETELEIERLMDAEQDELPRPIGGELGTVSDDLHAKYQYADYIKGTVQHRLDGMKIVLDCANGAAYELAPKIFTDLGAEVITIAAQPTGKNINEGCGSTHVSFVRDAVVKHEAHLGLSFDGDADRLIAVDEQGEEVDGDYILCICGKAMNEVGKLNHRTVVTTVMSNIGFYKAMEEMGMSANQTAVGDRYVMEEMRKGGYNLGGEQSGHVIFLDHIPTGDGILTALQLTSIVKGSGKKLSELKTMMRKYPQVLVNVKGVDKHKLPENEAVQQVIQEVESSLGDQGRVLVRPSGTEPLIRVMAEGPDKEVVEQHVQRIADIIAAECKL